MAITQTVNKALNLIGLGDPNWGNPTNQNASILDQILGTPLAIAAVAGTTNLLVTQCQYNCLRFTGALGANARYNIPIGVSGEFIIINATTGPFTLTIGHQSGGSSVIIDQNSQRSIYASNLAGVGGVIFVDNPLGASTTDKQVVYNSGGNLVGSSDLIFSPADGLSVERTDPTTNTVIPVNVLNRQSSGVPAIGIGVSQDFQIETAPGVTTLGASIRAISTAISSAAESFDFAINLRRLGAMFNAFRVTSTGDVQAQTVSGPWVATKLQAEAATDDNVIMTPLKTKELFDVQGDEKYLQLSSIITGIVNNGTKVFGVGFTSSKISTGRYRVTFTTPALNTNYIVVATMTMSTGVNASYIAFITTKGLNAFDLGVSDNQIDQLIDGTVNFVVFFSP